MVEHAITPPSPLLDNLPSHSKKREKEESNSHWNKSKEISLQQSQVKFLASSFENSRGSVQVCKFLLNFRNSFFLFVLLLPQIFKLLSICANCNYNFFSIEQFSHEFKSLVCLSQICCFSLTRSQILGHLLEFCV